MALVFSLLLVPRDSSSSDLGKERSLWQRRNKRTSPFEILDEMYSAAKRYASPKKMIYPIRMPKFLLLSQLEPISTDKTRLIRD